MHGYGVARFTAKCRRRAAAPRSLLAFYILDALVPSYGLFSARITLFAFRTARYLSFRAVHIDRPGPRETRDAPNRLFRHGYRFDEPSSGPSIPHRPTRHEGSNNCDSIRSIPVLVGGDLLRGPKLLPGTLFFLLLFLLSRVWITIAIDA